MKGQILTYAASSGTGVIAGDDGRRYGFSRAEWKGDGVPASGLTVDFEPRGSEAAAIYALPQPSPGPGLDLGAMRSSPVVQRGAHVLRSRVEAPLALLVLFACFLNYLSVSYTAGLSGPVTQGFSLFGAGKEVFTTLNSALPPFERASADELAAAGGMLAPRWLAPILAAALLVAVWTGRKARILAFAAGAGAVAAFLLAVGVTSAFGGALAQAGGLGRPPELKLGVGAWLMLLAGLGLVAAALGRLPNPFAPAAGRA